MSSRFAKPLPPINAAQILKAHGLRADKALGQNFLQDPYALEKIVNAAEILPTDTVLEVGPGLGALTRIWLDLDLIWSIALVAMGVMAILMIPAVADVPLLGSLCAAAGMPG